MIHRWERGRGPSRASPSPRRGEGEPLPDRGLPRISPALCRRSRRAPTDDVDIAVLSADRPSVDPVPCDPGRIQPGRNVQKWTKENPMSMMSYLKRVSVGHTAQIGKKRKAEGAVLTFPGSPNISEDKPEAIRILKDMAMSAGGWIGYKASNKLDESGETFQKIKDGCVPVDAVETFINGTFDEAEADLDVLEAEAAEEAATKPHAKKGKGRKGTGEAATEAHAEEGAGDNGTAP